MTDDPVHPLLLETLAQLRRREDLFRAAELAETPALAKACREDAHAANAQAAATFDEFEMLFPPAETHRERSQNDVDAELERRVAEVEKLARKSEMQSNIAQKAVAKLFHRQSQRNRRAD